MALTNNSKMPDSIPKVKNEQLEGRLVINISHKIKLSICKPLIPLKIALAIWFAASMGTTSYMSLFFKQRGLTLEEISFLYLIANLSQFVFNTACGVVSDKVGRPIYMTILSILIAGSVASCLAFLPNVSEAIDENQSFSSLYCGETNDFQLKSNRTCDNALQFVPCEDMCIQPCCEDISLSKLNLVEKFFSQNSMTALDNGSVYYFDWCVRDSKTVLFSNDSRWICGLHQSACDTSCSEYKGAVADRKGRVLLFIAFIVIFFVFDENIYRFLDILTNQMVKAFEVEYGRQIFWSNIGLLVGPSLVAMIIYQASKSEEVPNYESSLYFYTAVAILTIIVVSTLDVSKGKPAQEMSKAALKLLKNVDFFSFVCVMFVLGGTWGFHMSFHNLFLEEIGTPIYMMGIVDTFAGGCGLPVLVTGKWLTDKIGNTNIFTLALLGYFFKLFGYSYLRVAWPACFLELIMTVSYHLLWVATMDFCAKIAPEGLKGTVVMLAGTMHFSLGRACGSFAGGLLMSAYGAAAAFQIIGAINGVAFLLHSVFQFIRRCQRKKKLDIS